MVLLIFYANKKTGGTNRLSPCCTTGFRLIIFLFCRHTSRKLSTLTYPVTNFPAGVLPQYSALVVTR